MPKDSGDNNWKYHKRVLRERLGIAITSELDAQEGEYAWGPLAEKIATSNDDPEMMRALWRDACREIVHEELRRRSQIEINPNLGLWSGNDLNEGVILLGDGLAVKYRDATLDHWKKKEENQTKIIDSTTARREATRAIIEQLEHDMATDPTLTTGEWMKRRGFGNAA